ncbi:Sodium/calcium exchanger protein-domain-containing protein [Flagelloscypha sp. PMI_526]|nr:Sodium/calcium exchanger protein-domain-containing protein [Flagelloscypha sp. PMI_526]
MSSEPPITTGEPASRVDTDQTVSTVDNHKTRGPFERRINRKLFVRPAELRGPAPSNIESIKSAVTYSWVNVLLPLNPVAWALHYTHQNSIATFVIALLGVMPLASLLGHGTESVALYTGDALGGLLNASLGNATELIIAILLLVKCELRVVQASLLGGLLSNLLLVTGMAFLVGGIRFSEMEFRQTAAQLNTSLMTLAVIALIIPTIFAFALEQASGEDTERRVVLEMSRGASIILIIIYVLSLIFQLYSHSHLYNPDAIMEYRTPSTSTSSSRPSGPAPLTEVNRRLVQPRRANSLPFAGVRDPENGAFDAQSIEELESPAMNLLVSVVALVAATGLTYLTAEALTDSLEDIGNNGTVTKEWLGLILLAVVGNAAEHVTAVFVAYRNKVDLALAVSIGSCIQIALFVIPLLVIIGWCADIPLSLLFDPLEVAVLFLAVILVRFATEDGRTHYMSGVTLTFCYILIAYAFWYYPSNGTGSSSLFEQC